MSATLDKSGPGTDTLAVGTEDGHVFLIFEKPVKFVKLDAITALKIGERLARDSYKAFFGADGDDPTTQSKSVIADQKRAVLVVRVEHMIRSMQDKGEHPKFQAHAIVDQVMQELM